MKLRGGHVDLCGCEVVCVSASQRARMQVEMIRDHQWLMGCERGRPVGETEAVLDWIQQGYAELFARRCPPKGGR